MSKVETPTPRHEHQHQHEMAEIREDLDALRHNVVSLTRHVKAEGSAQAEDFKVAALERFAAMRDTGKEQLKSAEQRVKARPVQSVAVAFAAGVVASYLLGRRSS